MKKGKTSWGHEYDVPDGIIAHLTRECGGNVHERHVVDVTCGSFEKEPEGANWHSGVFDNEPMWAAKNAADLETVSYFMSGYDITASCIGENAIVSGHIRLPPRIAKNVSSLYSFQPSDHAQLRSGSQTASGVSDRAESHTDHWRLWRHFVIRYRDTRSSKTASNVISQQKSRRKYINWPYCGK
jgi:hypothetical protein